MDKKTWTDREIRDLIRDELQEFFGRDKYTVNKTMQFIDGKNIQSGRGTGTKIGTAADQKLSVYGETPVVQGATINDPSGAGDPGVDTPAREAINAIIDRLQAFGIIA